MVNERKEPTVSSVLSARENGVSKPARKPISPQPQVIEQKVSLSGLWAALLVALIAVAAAIFSYWQLMQTQGLLKDQQTSLKSQQQRIVELENQLALSDDESAQSLVAVSAKLKEANSEIRKLWGVSYDTNRKAIKANKTAIDSQSKRQQTLDKALQAQQTTVNSGNQRLSEQELLMRTLRERVDEQSNNVKSAAAAASDNQKRIAGNEEAIKAFDVFRRTVSRDLLQIKQTLKAPASR